LDRFYATYQEKAGDAFLLKLMRSAKKTFSLKSDDLLSEKRKLSLQLTERALT
jgi:hypothetical protein